MNYKFNTEQDWLKLARQANWSVAKLAELCGVSERTLRRYLQEHRGRRPRHGWPGNAKSRLLNSCATVLPSRKQRHGLATKIPKLSHANSRNSMANAQGLFLKNDNGLKAMG